MRKGPRSSRLEFGLEVLGRDAAGRRDPNRRDRPNGGSTHLDEPHRAPMPCSGISQSAEKGVENGHQQACQRHHDPHRHGNPGATVIEASTAHADVVRRRQPRPLRAGRARRHRGRPAALVRPGAAGARAVRAAGGNDHDDLDLGETLVDAAHPFEPYEERAATWTAQPAFAGELCFDYVTPGRACQPMWVVGSHGAGIVMQRANTDHGYVVFGLALPQPSGQVPGSHRSRTVLTVSSGSWRPPSSSRSSRSRSRRP